jgi:hypothetical protein
MLVRGGGRRCCRRDFNRQPQAIADGGLRHLCQAVRSDCSKKEKLLPLKKEKLLQSNSNLAQKKQPEKCGKSQPVFEYEQPLIFADHSILQTRSILF